MISDMNIDHRHGRTQRLTLYLSMNNQIMCVWVISITILVVVDSMKKNVVERRKCKMAKGNERTHAIVLGSFCDIIEPRERTSEHLRLYHFQKIWR